jgi:hypothetical protein
VSFPAAKIIRSR